MNYIDELLKSLYVMASMVEARDPYTGGHLWRVSQFSRILATDSKLPDTDIARIALGGFLHDLGKVGVPDAILKLVPMGQRGDVNQGATSFERGRLTPVADGIHAVNPFPDQTCLFLIEQQPLVHLLGGTTAAFADNIPQAGGTVADAGGTRGLIAQRHRADYTDT